MASESMLEFHILDVFTQTPFTGNPLAVVLGADDLSPAQMQILAREFNLSETIFVQRPVDPAHSARVRIFFPTAEIAFAGHPTIGCAIHLASAAHAGDFETLITLEEEAGLVPVRVSRQGADIEAEFTAPVLPHAAGQTPETALLARALDLPIAAIGPHLPGCFQGGPRFLYAPLTDLAALAAARPLEPYWSEALAIAGVDSVYLYVMQGAGQIRARMFSPTAGIPEDPATGSATAILAAQLLANGALHEGMQVFAVQQGIEMGRASALRLSIDLRGGKLEAIRIAGRAVPISSGRISIPPIPAQAPDL